jgi:signal transduction histidine kinase
MNRPATHRNLLLRAPVVVAMLFLAGVVFAASTIREIRAARATLEELTTGHAEQVRRVVGESQGHALAAFEAWETEAGDRLLALAALTDQLVRDRQGSQALLDSLAAGNNLACLSVRGGDLHVLASARVHDNRHQEAVCWAELSDGGAVDLKPGDSRVLHVPVAQGGGYRLVGAIRRADGGLVCAGMDEQAMVAARRRIGPGRLLQVLGQLGSTAYLALQDGRGIHAATPNVEQLSSVADDTLLAGVLRTGIPASREITFAGRPTLETVSRLDVSGRPVSLLRVGMDLSEVQRRQNEIERSLAVHSFLLLAAIGAGAALLLASRRLATTQAAWEQARSEVSALEAEQARRERSFALGELASGVAHEIRNPLNAIGVVAQRLGREFTPTEGQDEYRQLTTTVRGEVNRINRIIEQFLHYARPAAPSPRAVDLAALVRDMAALVRGRFDVKGVALEVQAPERLEADIDPDLLRQALHNLLDNALAACPPGAATTIELRAERGLALLTVRDTGPGIAPADLPRIFNLYHTTKPEGTGVGLAIVDQVAAQHGGRARVASEPGHGAAFTLELPLAGAAKEAP